MTLGLHSHLTASRRLRLAVILTALVFAIELAGGFWAHSLALLADAGHVAADVLALGLAWFAAVQSQRPADLRRTYGYHRARILAALGNALALLAIVAVVGYEAVRRLLRPQPVDGAAVVLTALVGLAINAVVIFLLHDHGRDLNLRAAMLHVASDLAAGIGVVTAGAVILFTGWLYADPLISIAISLLIAVGGFRILQEATNVLLEGAPRGLDLGDVETELLAGPHVRSVHDLHVWSVSPEHPALSAHLVVEPQSLAAGERLVRLLENRLCQKFGIGHTTIQLETAQPCGGGCAQDVTEHNHPHPA